MGEFGPENSISVLQMIEKREILNNELQYLKETHDLQNIPWFYTQNIKRGRRELKLWNRYDITISIIERRMDMLLLNIEELSELSRANSNEEKIIILAKIIEKALSETAAMIEFIKRCFIQRMEGQYQPPSQPPIFKIECIPGMNNLYKACDSISDYFMDLLNVEFRCVFRPLILIGGTRKIDVFPRERIVRLDEDSKFRSRFLFEIAHEISHLKIFEVIGDMRRICYRLDKEEMVRQILDAIMNLDEIREEIEEYFDEEGILEEISESEFGEDSKDQKYFEKRVKEKIEKRINLFFEGDKSHTYSTIADKKRYDIELFEKMKRTFEGNKDKFSKDRNSKFLRELDRRRRECDNEKELSQREKRYFRNFLILILNYFFIFKKEDTKYVVRITDFIIYMLFGLLPKKEEVKREFRYGKKHLIDLLCEYISVFIGSKSYVVCAYARFDDEENRKLYERILEFIEGDEFTKRDASIGFFRIFYDFLRKNHPEIIRNFLKIETDREIPKYLCKFLRKRTNILKAYNEIESKLTDDNNFAENAQECLEKLKGFDPDKVLYNFWIIHQGRLQQLTREGLTIKDIYTEYKLSSLLTMEIVNILSGGNYCD